MEYEYLVPDLDHLRPWHDPAFRASSARPACWSWPVPDKPELTDEADVLVFLKDWHQGRCAVCGRSGRRQVLDHDHLEHRARGYLCGSCNTHEGNRSNYFELMIYVAYRACCPADILDIDYPVADRGGQTAQSLLGKRGYEGSLLNPRYRSILRDWSEASTRRQCWGPLAMEYIRRRITELPPDVETRSTIDADHAPPQWLSTCGGVNTRHGRRACDWCLS